jgi:hypothetical protein
MPASYRATARRCPVPTLVSALLLGGLASASWAQTQVVKPPVAQYWMDVSTLRIAGMDEMPTPSENASFGAAPGRRLELAITTQRKPAGTQATQTIPAGMAMGSSLTLLPTPPAKSATPNPLTPQDDANAEMPDKPRGRILMYWGCGDTVRSGQPKILDATNANPQDYAQFMRGRGTRGRGATAAPGNSVWPNTASNERVPANASLQGQHIVSGDGIPAGLQFNLGEAQDFLPPLDVSANGDFAQAITLRWTAQAQARAYFLNAMGGSGDDMVIWSSAESPEPGWGLMDYLSPTNLTQWLGDKTLLPASQTACAIPSGIFAKSDGAMLQGIAYGQELNLVHPPRPQNKKLAWTPDWSAQVRVKSVTLLPLERDTRASQTNRKQAKPPVNPSSGPEMPDDGTEQKGLLPVVPGLPDVTGLGNVLKGLFGR